MRVARNSTSQRGGCQGRGEWIPFPLVASLEEPALRIAIVIERFAPRAGGVEKVAWQVAHELARTGDDVTVLTRDADPEAVDRSARAGAPCRIRSLPVPTGWQPLRVLAFSRAAARHARRGRFDVVHSFSRTRHQDLYRAGGGSHRDYLERSHDRAGRLARALSPRHRVLLSIEERVFRDPRQRVQCASRLVADRLTRRHGVAPERILLLPNAVDADRFGSPEALTRGRRLRARLDEKAERIEESWLRLYINRTR